MTTSGGGGGVGVGGTVTVTVGATGSASSPQLASPIVSASNATPANRTNFFMALLPNLDETRARHTR